MSLLRRHRTSDELDETAVAGKKHLALTAVTCLSSHRSDVMTTPRTRTDSATGMTSFHTCMILTLRKYDCHELKLLR